MLGGGSHTDDGVWPDGARTSGPTRRWRPRAASMSSQGPWLRISSALYTEFRASARAKPKGGLPWSPPRRPPRTRTGPVHSGWLGTYAPRSQVMHQARQVGPGSLSLPDGHLQGVQGQAGAHWPTGGLPADDPPRIHVSHESHVHPPGEGTNIGGGTSRLRGNVGAPQPTRSKRLEVAPDQVGRTLLPQRAARGARRLGASDTV